MNVSFYLASSHFSRPSFPLVLLRFFLLLSFIFLDPVKIFDSMGYGTINASSYTWPLVRTTTCIPLLTSHHSSIPPISSSPSFRLFSPSFHTGYITTCFLYTSLPFSSVLFPSPSAPLTVSPSSFPPLLLSSSAPLLLSSPLNTNSYHSYLSALHSGEPRLLYPLFYLLVDPRPDGMVRFICFLCKRFYYLGLHNSRPLSKQYPIFFSLVFSPFFSHYFL